MEQVLGKHHNNMFQEQVQRGISSATSSRVYVSPPNRIIAVHHSHTTATARRIAPIGYIQRFRPLYHERTICPWSATNQVQILGPHPTVFPHYASGHELVTTVQGREREGIPGASDTKKGKKRYRRWDIGLCLNIY